VVIDRCAVPCPGISREGIGTLGMLLNFAVTLSVSRVTPPPPAHAQAMVDEIRLPSRGQAAGSSAKRLRDPRFTRNFTDLRHRA